MAVEDLLGLTSTALVDSWEVACPAEDMALEAPEAPARAHILLLPTAVEVS